MKALSLFYPYVMPEVAGASAPLVDQAIVLTCRDFCQRTAVWTEWMGAIPPGTSNRFELDLTASQELVKVVKALAGTTELDVLSYRDVPRDWMDPASTQLTNKLVHLEGNEFLVFPLPTESIYLQLAFKPAVTAATVADVLFDSCAEDIGAGAKARLMAMRDKPFSDFNHAAVNRQAYEAGISQTANLGFAHRSPGARVTKKSRI